MMPTEVADEVRRRTVSEVRRVVLKVGSRLLTGIPGVALGRRISELIGVIDGLRRDGLEIVLVTSGAIGSGMVVTGRAQRPRDLPQLQALAAIGQSRLMADYEAACNAHAFHCAQLLLSADDVRDRKRHLNVCNCIAALLRQGVLPIVNENDTVSVDEIRFGDNDRLAALVATMLRADLTIVLTSEDGFREFTGGRLGARIPVVDRLTDELRAMATDTPDARFSTGGMISKLRAAEVCLGAGEPMWIVNGSDFGIIAKVLAGDDVGTLFVPGARRLSGSKRWLTFFSEPTGSVRIDDGAVAAVVRGGRSLLPSGIVSVAGDFDKGDTVAIEAADGTRVALGVSNYGAAELQTIKGLRSQQLATVLPGASYDEAVHRDNMALVVSAEPAGD